LNKYLKIILHLTIIFNIFIPNSFASEKSLWIQSTTSTRDSGLYNFILPIFEKKFGIKTYVVAVGTGQALQNAKNCDGDVLIVHSKELELKFISNGYGVKRNNLMYNDFVIIGPFKNPAEIQLSDSISLIFNKIAKTRAIFVSRGDNSGTHLAEMKIWSIANFDPLPFSGKWYLSTGQGMGPTLNISIGINAYSLTDRSTWLRYKNKLNHVILYENNPNLFNQYGIVMINKDHCGNLNQKSAQIFTDWILSKEGQDLISSFKFNGMQLFTPNYEQEE
jgi:tungstate transport system substrate-binding protein